MHFASNYYRVYRTNPKEYNARSLNMSQIIHRNNIRFDTIVHCHSFSIFSSQQISSLSVSDPRLKKIITRNIEQKQRERF